MLHNAWVYKEMFKALKTKKKCAIATVVTVNGSAYCPVGAKMLIKQEGDNIGMISGGCLEADVNEIAKQVMLSGVPELKWYDMNEDLVWGLGLGCPGEVEVYIEPLN